MFMKHAILSTLILFSLSTSALAETPNWKKGLLCGAYRMSGQYVNSQYSILLGSMKNGKIPAVLFKNWTDGSQAVGDSADACKMNEEGMLKCSVTERGLTGLTVSVTIDTNSEEAQSADKFPASFFNIKLIYSRTGDCQLRSTADSEFDYYTSGRINPLHTKSSD